LQQTRRTTKQIDGIAHKIVQEQEALRKIETLQSLPRYQANMPQTHNNKVLEIWSRQVWRERQRQA
jgi:hypothetical protein